MRRNELIAILIIFFLIRKEFQSGISIMVEILLSRDYEHQLFLEFTFLIIIIIIIKGISVEQFMGSFF